MPDVRKDVRLDNAIADLNAVYSESENDKQILFEVNNAIKNLQEKTDSYYINNKELTDEELDEIRIEYEKLLKACDNYIKQGKNLTDTGFGQGRLTCITAIRSLVCEDIAALHEAKGMEEEGRTLLAVVQEGRSVSAEIAEGEEINAVGGAMSSRIPIQLTMENGTVEEGFFTESQNVETTENAMANALAAHEEKYGKDSIEAKIANTIFNLSLSDINDLNTKSKDSIVEVLKSQEGDLEDPNILIVTSLVNQKLGADLMKELGKQENTELRRYYFSTINEAIDKFATSYMNSNVAKIPEGERIDKRNTAMSSVANYLGMGDLIAGARNFKLKINGVEKTGTFQQKAKGKHLDHLPEGDPMWEVAGKYGNDYSGVDTTTFKQQLSDLQVLDYICGNYDRHGGNMLYKIEKIRGQHVITGLTGIDNDLSFGLKETSDNDTGEKLVEPDDMRIMRESTAQKILEMTPATLDLVLKDMNFSKQEMDSCKNRLKNLQDKLRVDIEWKKKSNIDAIENGRILVVPDKDFAKFRITELGRRDPAHDKKRNYFERAAMIKKELSKRLNNRKFNDPESDIDYVRAKAEKGKINFLDEKLVTNINLEETAKSVAEAKRLFDNMGGKLYGKDTGHYEWMKKSVGQLNTYFEGLKQKNPNGKAVEIPSEDAIRLETMFRQIRKAGENYVKTHKNPWTPQGKTRKQMGVTMSQLRVTAGADAPVNANNGVKADKGAKTGQMDSSRKSVYIKNTNINKLLEKEMAENPDMNKNTGKTVNRTRSATVVRSKQKHM